MPWAGPYQRTCPVCFRARLLVQPPGAHRAARHAFVSPLEPSCSAWDTRVLCKYLRRKKEGGGKSVAGRANDSLLSRLPKRSHLTRGGGFQLTVESAPQMKSVAKCSPYLGTEFLLYYFLRKRRSKTSDSPPQVTWLWLPMSQAHQTAEDRGEQETGREKPEKQSQHRRGGGFWRLLQLSRAKGRTEPRTRSHSHTGACS